MKIANEKRENNKTIARVYDWFLENLRRFPTCRLTFVPSPPSSPRVTAFYVTVVVDVIGGVLGDAWCCDNVRDDGGGGGGGGATVVGHMPEVAAVHGTVGPIWLGGWRPAATILPAAVAAYTMAWW